MPPMILFAIGVVGCYAGAKLFARLMDQAAHSARQTGERVQREARATARVRDLGALEWDEAAGVYRPRTDRR